MTIEEIKEKLDKIITSPYGVKNVLNCLSKIEDKNEKIWLFKRYFKWWTKNRQYKTRGRKWLTKMMMLI